MISRVGHRGSSRCSSISSSTVVVGYYRCTLKLGAEGRTILPVQQLQPHGINLTTSMLAWEQYSILVTARDYYTIQEHVSSCRDSRTRYG